MIEGLKPYAEYKESGLPWLGRCPKDWSIRRTKILFHERVQKGFPNEPLLAATQTKGVVKKEDYETRTVTAQKDLHLLKLVEVGDYVISLRSFQGGIEVAHCRGIISPAYTVLKPLEQATSGYYSHFFKAKPFIDSLSLFVTGIREGQNIDYERLSRAEMPMPSENEQAAIVRFLDHANRKIDGFIRAKRKLIGLLNEQKQTIIHRAVTRGLHSDVPLKPSGIPWLGDIPEHWDTTRCGGLFREVVDVGHPNARLLSIDRFKGIIPQDETGRRTRASHDRGAYKRVKPGQLAYNLMNAFMGALGFSQYDGIVSPAYAVAQPLRDIDTRYFHYLLRTSSYTGEFNRQSYGIMYERNRLYFERFKLVRALLPPLGEQKMIADWIETNTGSINTAIARTEREIALMQEYRTRLTADIVTGKLDVREAAANLPDPSGNTAFDAPLEEIEDELEESNDVNT